MEGRPKYGHLILLKPPWPKSFEGPLRMLAEAWDMDTLTTASMCRVQRVAEIFGLDPAAWFDFVMQFNVPADRILAEAESGLAVAEQLAVLETIPPDDL